jgi:hypothetical protein
MASATWGYQWKANHEGNDPRTCRLFDANREDMAIHLVEGSLLQNYGTPKYFEHQEGPGLYWDNEGSWGIWVLRIKPREGE